MNVQENFISMNINSETIEYLGNKEILKLNKTAFLCSRHYPASIVLKAYDWAIAQKDAGNCIISGFHSQIEKDVFYYLLNGTQPVILVHARGLKIREDKQILKEVEKGRLLIISPFSQKVIKITSKTAQRRNYFMAKLADEIVVGYADKGGNIERLLQKIKNKKVILI